jgi:DNA-binding response OmpR family regulator
MICIIILNQRSYLSCYPTSNLHKTDFIASTEVDATDFISTANPEIFNGNEQTHWQLNSSQLQLIAPDNKAIPLSNNECCILRAVINANKNLVSRKTLIEALGQEYWQYD